MVLIKKRTKKASYRSALWWILALCSLSFFSFLSLCLSSNFSEFEQICYLEKMLVACLDEHFSQKYFLIIKKAHHYCFSATLRLLLLPLLPHHHGSTMPPQSTPPLKPPKPPLLLSTITTTISNTSNRVEANTAHPGAGVLGWESWGGSPGCESWGVSPGV